MFFCCFFFFFFLGGGGGLGVFWSLGFGRGCWYLGMRLHL